MLGLFSEMPYDDADVDLRPGDVLVAFTDGVTEARNAAGDEFGEDRLKDLLREAVANPNAAPAEVEVAFLKAGVVGPTLTYRLPPTSRHNIWVNGDVPGLGQGVFSAEVRVLNYQPIVVEKAMYWNLADEVWAAGTGVVATPLPPP